MAALRGLVVASVLAAGAGAHASPLIDYTLHCRGCHGPDGDGAREAVPSFRGQLGKFLWVAGGREFLIQVPGSAQSELSDARLAALLNWMLQRFSPNEVPADFTPLTEDDVKRHRHPLAEVETTRAALIRAIDAAAAERTPVPEQRSSDH